MEKKKELLKKYPLYAGPLHDKLLHSDSVRINPLWRWLRHYVVMVVTFFFFCFSSTHRLSEGSSIYIHNNICNLHYFLIELNFKRKPTVEKWLSQELFQIHPLHQSPLSMEIQMKSWKINWALMTTSTPICLRKPTIKLTTETALGRRLLDFYFLSIFVLLSCPSPGRTLSWGWFQG